MASTLLSLGAARRAIRTDLALPREYRSRLVNAIESQQIFAGP